MNKEKEINEQYRYDDEELLDAVLDDSYKMYIIETKRYPLLSAEETANLFEKMANGDKKAREKLINSNLRLVVHIALKYINKVSHLKILDLIQYGNEALIKTVDNFDITKNYMFSTYAFSMIEGVIRSAVIRNEEDIYIERDILTLQKKYLSILNNNPNIQDKEMIDILDIDEEILKKIKLSLRKIMSLDVPIINETFDTITYKDIIEDPNDYYEVLFEEMSSEDSLKCVKEVLNPSEYYVAYYRIFSPVPLNSQELQKRFNVSRTRVYQIEDNVKYKLKTMFKTKEAYEEFKQELLRNEKQKFNLIKTKPIDPLHIIIYQYIKDSLTIYEARMYYYIFFGKYDYSFTQIGVLLNISRESVKKIYITLNGKIKRLLSDREKFEEFKNNNLKAKRVLNMYKIDFSQTTYDIDYNYLIEKYNTMSFYDFLEQFDEIIEKLPSETIELLKKYFDFEEQEEEIEDDRSIVNKNIMDDLNNKSKEEVILIIKENPSITKCSTTRKLMRKLNIKNREIMTDEELKRVYQILNMLENKKSLEYMPKLQQK